MKIEREDIFPCYRLICGELIIAVFPDGRVEWPDIKNISIADAEELGDAIRVVGMAAQQLKQGASHTMLDLWKHTIEHPAIDLAIS